MDIDPSEVDKNVMTALPLVGDMKENLTKLSERVQKLEIEHWWHTIRAWDATENRSAQSGDRLTAPWLMKELTRSFKGEDAVFVTDVGQNQMWAALHLEVDAPRHHLTSGGCGTMGFGLPAALGAKISRPEAQVVQICGDGGFKIQVWKCIRHCVKARLLSPLSSTTAVWVWYGSGSRFFMINVILRRF